MYTLLKSYITLFLGSSTSGSTFGGNRGGARGGVQGGWPQNKLVLNGERSGVKATEFSSFFGVMIICFSGRVPAVAFLDGTKEFRQKNSNPGCISRDCRRNHGSPGSAPASSSEDVTLLAAASINSPCSTSSRTRSNGEPGDNGMTRSWWLWGEPQWQWMVILMTTLYPYMIL